MKDILSYIKNHQELLRKVFLVLVSFQFLSIALKFLFKAEPGWDHDVYCHALSALNNGLDPYLTKNIGVPFSFTYPALFLPAYSGLCAFSSNLYIGFDILLILAIVVCLQKYLKSSLVLTLPFVFFGFNATYWNFQSGNLGILEGLFFALALVGLVKERWWASLFLVPMSFLKIVPAALTLPFGYFVSSRWMDKFKSWIIFGVGLVLLEIINYFYSPNLLVSFLNQITGKYSDQHSPARELVSDKSNPTVPLFFKNLAAMISTEYWVVLFGFFMFSLLLFSVWVWRKTIRNEKDSLYKACWAMLILFLWLPRLKPYSFMLVVIALLPLLSKLSRKFAFSVLLLSIFHRVINGENPNLWLGFLANNTAIYTLFAVISMTAVRWEKVQQSDSSVPEGLS